MPAEVALRNEPAASGIAASGIEEAEAHLSEACTLLVRGDPAGIEQAGEQFRNAIEILTGWQRQPSGGNSPRRLGLHRSVERAGRLLEAAGRWRRHRRSLLAPEASTPPCYGADGRTVAAPTAGSTMLQG